MKQRLLRLLKARHLQFKRVRVFGRDRQEIMAEQIRSMGRFGQDLVVMSR